MTGRIAMRTILLAAMFGALAVSAMPAAAEITYPWCAQYGERDGARNCGFSTWNQCMAALSGNGGYCIENPMYQPAAQGASRRSRR
jgi:Protein of unknown function (DUF3551)